MSPPLSIDYLGHSSLVVELDGIRLLTDPAVRERIGLLRRTVPEPATRMLEGIDLVLVSHLHWDHLDLPSLRRVGRAARIVVPAGAGAWLRSHGFDDVVEAEAGRVITAGGLSIEPVAARHGGKRPPLGPTTRALGYVVRGSRSIWFAGDTDLYPAMAALRGSVDVALLPVWGWGPMLGRGLHLDPARATAAARLVDARTAIPIHWGTYWPKGMGRVRPGRLVDPPREFIRLSALVPGLKVAAAEVGASVVLP
ncbi:MAG: MBL fold metallo-hydrolase [Chloroflexota bacterium]|nr:MBL fold metallo-hydrolase [Chloroflexota bacterium]